MTIILQHQYWGLKVREDDFEVALTFKKLPATLTIPFQALTKFFDPGVPFGLEFKVTEAEVKAGPVKSAEPAPEPKADASGDEPAPVEKPPAAGEVVSLDSFRKK
jgi:uncharacterized protein